MREPLTVGLQDSCTHGTRRLRTRIWWISHSRIWEAGGVTSTCVGLTWWIDFVGWSRVIDRSWRGRFLSSRADGTAGLRAERWRVMWAGVLGISVELLRWVCSRQLSLSARPGTNRVNWSLAVACFSSRVWKIALIRTGAGRKTRLFSRAVVPYRIF